MQSDTVIPIKLICDNRDVVIKNMQLGITEALKKKQYWQLIDLYSLQLE